MDAETLKAVIDLEERVKKLENKKSFNILCIFRLHNWCDFLIRPYSSSYRKCKWCHKEEIGIFNVCNGDMCWVDKGKFR